MSKSSTASSKPLSTKSAWAKGPPQYSSASSPRSQSPALPNVPSYVQPTHSRRPSQLGQGIPIKDGVSIPRSNVDALKQGSSVTFGTINDASAPISSSPVPAPAIKTDSVKSFGSVPANGPVNGNASLASQAVSSNSSSKPPSSSASTAAASTSALPHKPTVSKMDIAKLFQGSGSSSNPPPPSETQSPSVRPSNLPPTSNHPPSHPHQGPPLQPGQPSQMSPYPFVPAALRNQQNGGPGGPSGGPRSPSFNRNMPNGNSSRPPNGPNASSNAPSIPPPMSSPRLQAHQHPPQPPPMAPPVQGWPQYPYTYYDPYSYMYMPQAMPPPPNTLGPPHVGMPMSPRTGPMPLQPPAPGTPTPSHAVPSHTPHTPHPPPLSHSISNSVSSVSSTPSTPSTSTTPLSARLNTTAASFVPNRAPSKVSIKAPDGAEIKIENWKKGSPGPGTASPATAAPPVSFNSPGSNRRSIRLESEDAKKKRLAEEEEKQRKAKEAEQAKRDAEEKAQKELERKQKEEEERKLKEEEEKRKEEEAAKERLRKEEEEKVRKAAEEKERARKEAEEKERLRLEEAERVRKEKEAAEEAERVRKAEEEERLRKEEEERERAKLEAEAKAKADEQAAEAATTATTTSTEEPEDGEVVEEKSAPAPLPATNGSIKSSKESLRIDTAGATDPIRRRPGPLDLSGTKSASIASPLPSALATARRIEDLGRIQYPEGIKSPSVELNANAKDSKFRYDRDFLLQFMKVCTEKPDMLPPLDAIGLQPSEQTSYTMIRGGSGRHRQSSGAAPPLNRQGSTGLNFNPIQGLGKPSPINPFNMGQFATPGAGKMSSEDRFAMSNRSASGPAGMAFGGRPTPMARTTSQGGPSPMNNKRTRSKRGDDRASNKATGGSQHGHGSNFTSGALAQSALGMEPVVPLKQTANRWDRKALAGDADAPEMVDRKVKALLNKLTMEKFDSISDQIIEWANKSEKEKDGRTLIQVIRLVFEKATDEATWSEMYARLCRKMMEKISPEVQDDGIKNAEGKPIAGGQLFRKYLLNRCQEDFERGWFAKEATAAAAKTKAAQDSAVKAASEKAKENDESSEEVALYSEEYYAAQKAKRQGLGLIKFIGELFKLQMLTERIMHECVKKLLGNVDNPEEEEIESLCKLLTTVGQILDVPKARAHMDVYFSRMKDLIKSPNVSSRMQFMLQDVIELRERKWVSRNQVAAPATIAQIHEAAAKEKAVAERDALQKSQLTMSRGGSRRGGERNELTGPDGWTTRPPTKAGDLSQFGKINKGAPINFGPGSVFAGKKGAAEKKEAISRTSSSSNMFSMLSGNPEVAMSETAASKASRPPSRKASIDLSQSGAPEVRERRRLALLPRTKPLEESVAAPAQEESSDSEDAEAAPAMTSEAAKKKIEEDIKEFFAVRNLEEAEVYFSGLPSEHHPKLVDKLLSHALESKQADAELVGSLFTRASSKDLCSSTSFEEGFMGIAEFLEDIAIDAPKAWDLMAIVVKGAVLDEDARGRVAAKTGDAPKLLALLS